MDGNLHYRLSDQIRFTAPESDLLTHFAAVLVNGVNRRGITLTLERDFTKLRDLWTEHADNRNGMRLIPVLDVNEGPIEEGFWLRGTNEGGETVVMQAARPRRLPDSQSVGDAMRTLSFFYNNPAASIEPDESIEIRARAPFEILGPVIYSGGLWVRPDYRGRCLARFMTPLCHVLAHGHYGMDTIVSIALAAHNDCGIVARYGYRRWEDGVLWRKPSYRGDFHTHFLWKSARDLKEDLMILDGCRTDA